MFSLSSAHGTGLAAGETSERTAGPVGMKSLSVDRTPYTLIKGTHYTGHSVNTQYLYELVQVLLTSQSYSPIMTGAGMD